MSQDKLPEGKNPAPPRKTEGRGSPRVSAISSAFIEHSTLLKRFLTRYFYRPQDIEDVVQEVYIRARTAEQGVEIGHPKAFLFRIARNIAMNELKRKSRYIEDSIDADDGHSLDYATATLEEEMEARQHLGLYCEAIASLPEQCRRVCLLRKVHGLKHQQIAERLSISLSSVEKYLRKGALVCDDYVLVREQGAAATTQSNAPQGKPTARPSVTHIAGRKVPTRRESD